MPPTDEPRIDCHCHVIDPARFPFEDETIYRPSGPEIAPVENLRRIMAQHGIEHALIVGTNSGYGTDLSPVLEALARGNGRFKGIAVVMNDITMAELVRLKALGMIGVAFNAPFHGVDHYAGTADLLRKLADLDMILNLQVRAEQLLSFLPLIECSTVRLVVDHCGRPVPEAGLAQPGLSPLLAVALVMILAAFGFKVAAAPFHLWAPDVYEGAPPVAAALVASASKLAGFTLLVRLLWPGLGAVAAGSGLPGWLPVVALISAASLLLGNFGALAQSNLRRLLAYSAIAHAGALLLGVMAAGAAGPGPLFYYAATYGLATVGAFGVVTVLDQAGVGPGITDLAGLHRRSPLLAGCLLVFVLSLAGIPPLAGFVGKFLVFAAALRLGGLHSPAGVLAFAAIFLSAVALYYYLGVLKAALVTATTPDQETRITVPVPAAVTLVAAALLLLLLGLWPSALLGLFS